MSESDARMVLSHATVRDYPARYWLYRQGEPSKELFLLQLGVVRLSQLTADGGDILVRFTTAAGEVFGYHSLSPGGANEVSAQVIRPSRIAVWEKEEAIKLLQSYPRAAFNLFSIAARDVAYFRDRARRLVSDCVGLRVKWAIAELVRTIGIQAPEGVVIALDIGQSELAELADTNIFTVSRELGKLERQGVLKTGRGRIVVHRPGKLLEEW